MLAPLAGRLAGTIIAALAVAAAMAPVAAAQTPGSAGTPDSGALATPPVFDRPPPGRQRSAREVLQIAERLPDVRAARARSRSTYPRIFLKGRDRWQVAFYAVREPGADEEIAQVVVDDATGRPLETWTGVQVAWTMARGYPGAFGGKASAAYVWVPLLVLFLLPFLRPPWRMLHLDLVAVASLSVSYALFNSALIEWSVPLAYPPLLYLLARGLWVARARARPGAAPAGEVRLLLGAQVLGLGIVFLLGFRLGLNLTASNAIDVGYSGVIGADLLAAGDGLYGDFPSDNPRGDTYGPAVYYAYVPFEAALPWSGRWDSLPAAHAAALAFDLLSATGAWLLGRRLEGPRLGVLLAYLWLACPWTLLVVNSSANDSLVAVTVLAALLLAGRPLGRGAAVAVAGLTKFAPLALAPLFILHPAGPGRSGSRAALLTLAGLVAAAAALLVPVAILDEGLRDFVARTAGFQLDRDSPFSVWGLWSWEAAQRAVQAAGVALAVAVAFVPRRRDLASLCALSAAVLLAFQIGASHWFYLYVVWFLAPLLAAVLVHHAPAHADGGSVGRLRDGRPDTSVV